jgi:hypothetical protein
VGVGSEEAENGFSELISIKFLSFVLELYVMCDSNEFFFFFPSLSLNVCNLYVIYWVSKSGFRSCYSLKKKKKGGK